MKIQKDKVIHFAICCIVAVCAMVFFRLIASPLNVAVVASLIIGLALGVGKEYGDQANPYNKWDWFDLLADALGAVVGTLVTITLWYV